MTLLRNIILLVAVCAYITAGDMLGLLEQVQ